MSDASLGAAVAVITLAIVIWQCISFLRQGRWYRRLDAEKQAELRQADESWDINHGRRLSWRMIVAGVLVACGVLCYFVCRDLRVLG